MGPVFSLPVIEDSFLDLSPSLHSSCRLDATFSVSDFAKLDLTTPLQSFSHCGAFVPACAWVSLDVLLFVLDFVMPGPSPLARSSSQPGFLPLVPNPARPDAPTPPRGLGALGPSLLVLQSCRLGAPPSLSDMVSLGFFLPLRSHICLELIPSTLDFSNLGLNLSARHVTRFGLTLPASSRTSPGPLLSALDSLQPELPLFARSMARVGLVLLALDPLHLGLLPSARQLARLDFTPFASSRATFDSSLPALDLLNPGLSPSARSFVRPGPLLPVLDHLKPGPFSPSRSAICLGIAVAASGGTCFDFVVLALDFTCLGPAVSARSMV